MVVSPHAGIHAGVHPAMIPRRVSARPRSSAGVNDHRDLRATVLSEKRGREPYQRYPHQAQHVDQEQPAVVTLDVVKDAVVGYPANADDPEADEEAGEPGQELEQLLRKLRRHQVGRYFVNLEVQRQQGDRDGEYAIAENTVRSICAPLSSPRSSGSTMLFTPLSS